MDDALAQSDCLVRALPLDTLAAVVQAPDLPADVQEALDSARAGCPGG
jgi:preprotein translocase subunit Sec63